MDAYTAVKPVRFNRNYEVGEVIPGDVIDPRAVKRLVEAGKIAPAPTSGLIDGGKEETVAYLEDILGIDFDDTEPPDLEMRAATCKEIIVEIKNAILHLKSQDEKQNVTGEDDSSGTETTEEAQKTPQNEPQGADGIKQDDNQNVQESVQEAPEMLDDLTCPTCGRKCANKAALTTHMKTHNAG